MTNNKNAPCKNCADRSIGCHGICKDYMEWAKNERVRKEYIKEHMPPIINRHQFVGLGFPNKTYGKIKKRRTSK